MGTTLGSPGWRDSAETFCSPWVGGERGRLWTTPDAVYLSVSMNCNSLAERYCSAEYGVDYQSVFVNRGSGWEVLRQDIDNPAMIPVGVQGTALISIGSCAAGKFELDGTFSCLGNRAAWSLKAVTRQDRVFHLAPTVEPAGVLTQYRDGEWTELACFGADVEPSVLLDLGEELLVAGRDGTVTKVNPDTGETTAMAAPPGDYFDGVALPGGNFALLDIMGVPGNVNALVVYRDGNWTRIPFTHYVYQLGVAPSGNIYVRSYEELFRIDQSGTLETILHLEGQTAGIEELAVNSDQEIFLVLGSPELADTHCGGLLPAWFDGSELHLM